MEESGKELSEDIFDREEGLRRDSQHLVKRLSPRERQVFELLAAGLGVRTISERLGLDPRTVEVHQANMMRKLGASSMAEAIWVALYADIGRPA